MRIDLNRTAANDVAAEQQTKQVAAAEHSKTNAVAHEDTTSFSTDSVAVSDLTAKALQTPEVRQDKVNSLRQAVQNGSYKVDPQAVADAMLKEEFDK